MSLDAQAVSRLSPEVKAEYDLRMNEPEVLPSLKIVFVGNNAVGKTCLL